MSFNFLTSESVSPGHPDKIADQIADALLDDILTRDKSARVAVEVLVKSNLILVAGEITTFVKYDVEQIVFRVLNSLGYQHLDIDLKNIIILTKISKQSSDIKIGVDKESKKIQGAGDQGTMFGYAVSDAPNYMPYPIYYAHQLMLRQKYLVDISQCKIIKPDAKTQVSLVYDNSGEVKGFSSCIFSTQHDEFISIKELREFVYKEILEYVFGLEKLKRFDKIYINPTGRFVLGGALADCGITGRKLMVDTYGGASRHGGGAFSGKDPSKVDRTAAYMARYLAKNIVASGVSKKCEVQLSYSIGVSIPVALNVNTFNTGIIGDELITNWILKNIDLTPCGMINSLNLLDTKYLPLATFGHFGRDGYSWEKLDLVKKMQNDLI